MVASREAPRKTFKLSLESADILVHLRNLNLHVIQVIPMLPNQHLQLLTLDLVLGLNLSPAVVCNILLLGLDCEIQRAVVFHE